MAIARPTGALDEDADRECEHPAPHDATAVACVPDPRELGGAGISLCPFHLALWNDIHEGIVEDAGCADLMADDPLLHLADLPLTMEFGGALLDRVGIDHTGHAHYIWTHPNGILVKILDSDLEAVGTHTYHKPGVENWLEHVKRERGWMLVDDDYSAVVRERDR